MIDKSSFENKAIRLHVPDGDAEPEPLKGPASVVCASCKTETSWFASQIPPVCPSCGGRVDYKHGTNTNR